MIKNEDKITDIVPSKVPALPIIPADLTLAVFGFTIITSLGFIK